MDRPRILTLPLLIVASAALTLTGCSSDSGSGKNTPSDGTGNDVSSPAASAPGDAAKDGQGTRPEDAGKDLVHVKYNGAESGEFAATSVGCAVIRGKLATVSVPDANDTDADDHLPSLSAVISDGTATVTVSTRRDAPYLKNGAESKFTSRKSSGVWTVILSGLKVYPTDMKGDPLILNGTITCGNVAEI
ncbi:hypothetical protein [Streptomyces diastaticus]|uniref:hypothetical protein n=1 Tax=Streptomyces diastaticus TaxID=1956 RepID=UPI003806D0A6